MNKCEKCTYWCVHTGTCDYILIAGERRGCPIDDCTRFEKNKTDKRKRFAPIQIKKARKPPKPYVHPDEEAMMRLYKQGMSDGKIANATSVSRRSVFLWRKRNGLPSNLRKDDHGQ